MHAIKVIAFLILLLAVTGLGVPLTTGARPPATVPRVGVIGERSAGDPFLEAFRQRLHEHGYTEGKNIVLVHNARVMSIASAVVFPLAMIVA